MMRIRVIFYRRTGHYGTDYNKQIEKCFDGETAEDCMIQFNEYKNCHDLSKFTTPEIISVEDTEIENYAKKITRLIDRFISSSMNPVPMNDSEIIEKLTEIFTREELKKYGFGNFIKQYFDEEE